MKTWKKMAISLAICLTLIGGGLVAAGYVMGGEGAVTMNILGQPFRIQMFGFANQVTTVDEGEVGAFTTLDVGSSWGDIRVETGDDYGVSITDNNEEGLTYSNVDGILKIRDNHSIRIIGLGFYGTRGSNMIVTVPAGVVLDEIIVSADAGDVRVSGISADKLSATNNFGNLRIENSTFSDAELSLDAGELRIENSIITDCRAENAFGEIVARKFDSTNLEVNNNAGRIDLRGDLRNVDANGDFGSITVKTTLPASNFSYDLDTEFGEVRVDGDKDGNGRNTNPGADYTINLKQSSGDIRLDFEDGPL